MHMLHIYMYPCEHVRVYICAISASIFRRQCYIIKQSEICMHAYIYVNVHNSMHLGGCLLEAEATMVRGIHAEVPRLRVKERKEKWAVPHSFLLDMHRYFGEVNKNGIRSWRGK